MRAGLGQIGIRRIFLSHRLRVTRSFEHVAFPVNPSVSNVLNDECDEQPGDHDGSRSSLIFDALDAVVVEEEFGVREKLYSVSGRLQMSADQKSIHVQWRSK